MAGLVLLGGMLVISGDGSPVPAPYTVAAVREGVASGPEDGALVAAAKGRGKNKAKAKGKRGGASAAGSEVGAGGKARGKAQGRSAGQKRRGKRGAAASSFSAMPAAAAEDKAADAPPVKLPEPPALPTNYTAVGVLPLEAYDVPDEIQGTISQAIQDEVDQISGFRSVSPGDLQTDWAQVGLKADCDRDVECLAKAGRYGRAHLVLETRVSALAGADAISIRVIDTQKNQEVNRVAEPLAEDTQSQALQIHRLITQLLTLDVYEGNITFLCDVDGAEIYLDDKLLGVSPLPSQDHLHAGVHILRVSKIGYSDVNRFVDVVLNRSSTIQVNMNTATVAGVIVEMRSQTGFGSIFAVSQEAGWDIRVDGEPLGMMPLSAPMDKIPVGKHHITMKKAGQPAVAFDVDVKADQRTSFLLNITDKGPVFVAGPTEDPKKELPTIETILNPPPPPAPPPPPLVETHTFPTWRTWTAIGAGGAGAALLGLSGYYGHQVEDLNAQAVVDANTLAGVDNVQDYNTTRAKLIDTNAAGVKAERNEWITLGVGGALVATGAGLLIWDLVHTELRPAKTEPATAPTLQPGVAPAAAPDAAPDPSGAPPTQPAPAAAAPKTSWWLTPVLAPGGGGLQAGLTW